MTEKLFSKSAELELSDLKSFSTLLPTFLLGSAPSSEEKTLLNVLVSTGLCSSKSEARKALKSGALSLKPAGVSSFEKLFPVDETRPLSEPTLLKKGKNKFAIIL